MMTQRPVTGSFRKSAMKLKVERVLHHFDVERAAGCPCDADDVEPTGEVRETFAAQVCRSQPAQAMLFLPRHRIERCAETATRTGPDFDKHELAPVTRDDIELAAAGP